MMRRAIFIFFLPLVSADAFLVRSYWLFDQMEELPLPTTYGESRTQVFLNQTHLLDTLSSGIGIFTEMVGVELGVKGSYRTFLGATEQGIFLREKLKDSSRTLSVELAKHHVSLQNHFGRLSLELFYFMPSGKRWLKASVQTGVIKTTQVPWNLWLRTSFIRPFGDGYPFLIVAGETSRSYFLSELSSFDIGGALLWSYLIKEAALDPGLYEHMVFTLGPTFQYQFKAHRIRLSLSWKLALDKEVVDVSTGRKEVYPNEMRPLPDAQITYALTF